MLAYPIARRRLTPYRLRAPLEQVRLQPGSGWERIKLKQRSEPAL